MARVTKVIKGFLNLSEEDKKEFLETLQKEEELELEEQEQEEEKTEEKQEQKKEVKKEVKEVDEKEQVITLNKTDLEALIEGITKQFVSKEELDEVKQTVDKTVKKAQPFGKEQKKSKEDKVEEFNMNDYLAKVNSQFV